VRSPQAACAAADEDKKTRGSPRCERASAVSTITGTNASPRPPVLIGEEKLTMKSLTPAGKKAEKE
jgi:hypothetical protein